MDIHLTPDQIDKVAWIAAREGRPATELAGELFSRFLNEETRFIAAVERGEAELDLGDFLTHEEMGTRIRQLRGA